MGTARLAWIVDCWGVRLARTWPYCVMVVVQAWAIVHVTVATEDMSSKRGSVAEKDPNGLERQRNMELQGKRPQQRQQDGQANISNECGQQQRRKAQNTMEDKSSIRRYCSKMARGASHDQSSQQMKTRAGEKVKRSWQRRARAPQDGSAKKDWSSAERRKRQGNISIAQEDATTTRESKNSKSNTGKRVIYAAPV